MDLDELSIKSIYIIYIQSIATSKELKSNTDVLCLV